MLHLSLQRYFTPSFEEETPHQLREDKPHFLGQVTRLYTFPGLDVPGTGEDANVTTSSFGRFCFFFSHSVFALSVYEPQCLGIA